MDSATGVGGEGPRSIQGTSTESVTMLPSGYKVDFFPNFFASFMGWGGHKWEGMVIGVYGAELQENQ